MEVRFSNKINLGAASTSTVCGSLQYESVYAKKRIDFKSRRCSFVCPDATSIMYFTGNILRVHSSITSYILMYALN